MRDFFPLRGRPGDQGPLCAFCVIGRLGMGCGGGGRCAPGIACTPPVEPAVRQRRMRTGCVAEPSVGRAPSFLCADEYATWAAR